MKNEHAVYDVLIIGCGISGLAAAISAAEEGQKVCVISKEADLTETNTKYAQGGIVAEGKDDSPELLGKDIIKAGSNLNYNEAVEVLSKEGPSMVWEYLVEKAKIPFYKKGEHFDLTREAAHSVRRILHVKDKTGDAVEVGLLSFARSYKNITFLSGHFAVELITNSHNSRDPQQRYQATRVIGAYVFDESAEEVKKIFSSAVILATGGLGNLFLHTTNPRCATGDGIAMAYRVGAQIINAEYVQFHPTSLYHRDVERFLITEAMRGEGAKLMNRKGEYFMEQYHPELGDLAPRDAVARAIYKEMEKDDSNFVFLDTTIVKEIALDQRFPMIYEKCMDIEIDITRKPIPVVPAAHYFCGGVKVDLNGKTNIPGLYAVGENACTGVHGANRLASVSLLEGLYFGIRSGKVIARTEKPSSKEIIQNIPDWIYPEAQEAFDPVLIQNDMNSIKSTMWNYAGIIRTRKRLLRALSDLNYLGHRIERFYKEARLTKKLIELRNSVITATLIARAALGNTTSRGCHYIKNTGEGK